jgi:hypothetical protein
MRPDVRAYFEEEVIPFVRREFPELLPGMSIQVRGSHGLGTADELSDLDAAIWLEDDAWRTQGGRLQLRLGHEVEPFAPPDVQAGHYHPEVCVWPLSNLGALRKVAEEGADPPWDDVSFEELFEAREGLVVSDPPGRFARLKEATEPERCPEHVWKKRLIVELKALLYDDYVEFRSAVRRRRTLESHVLLGRLLYSLVRVGFLVSKRYYPWRSHLWWAFGRLPEPRDEVLPHLETAVSDADWERKLRAVQEATTVYRAHIASAGLLPEVDVLADDAVEELVWAERLEAWRNPDWRDWVDSCKGKALRQGCSKGDFWIWSLWGWD